MAYSKIQKSGFSQRISKCLMSCNKIHVCSKYNAPPSTQQPVLPTLLLSEIHVTITQTYYFTNKLTNVKLLHIIRGENASSAASNYANKIMYINPQKCCVILLEQYQSITFEGIVRSQHLRKL